MRIEIVILQLNRFLLENDGLLKSKLYSEMD